ncbi:AMP-binding protein [Streptomyces sp. KS 21]|uniref:AMP-binding protein n=1 Tax=Streptomyces sp. KS 21 TaxID=2485150 RepID=UPI0010E74EF6|nr:AMP-binding protein [Streptomyces sp. KS 21]TDU74704.1 AMP-binding enzyme [Streptomyces sp. KS 21]
MDHSIIHKESGPDATFMLQDYEQARTDFTWDRARSRLSGLPGGGLNIGYEAVDRHLAAGHGRREALRCTAADDTVTHLTYAELGSLTGRFANVLTALGVGRQERVFTLLGRCPELYATVLGTLRSARVLCPLFSARGVRRPAHGSGGHGAAPLHQRHDRYPRASSMGRPTSRPAPP